MIFRIIPVCGILLSSALIMVNLINVASAQTLAEFVILNLITSSSNVKNQGQCIHTVPQLASSAGVLEGLTEKQIKDFVKIICKERFES
jgi:hypothetical protein